MRKMLLLTLLVFSLFLVAVHTVSAGHWQTKFYDNAESGTYAGNGWTSGGSYTTTYHYSGTHSIEHGTGGGYIYNENGSLSSLTYPMKITYYMYETSTTGNDGLGLKPVGIGCGDTNFAGGTANARTPMSCNTVGTTPYSANTWYLASQEYYNSTWIEYKVGSTVLYNGSITAVNSTPSIIGWYRDTGQNAYIDNVNVSVWNASSPSAPQNISNVDYTINNTSPTIYENISLTVSPIPSNTTSPTYQISWGDGSSNSTSSTSIHTYTTVGTYDINITATDGQGNNVTNSTTITINNFLNGTQHWTKYPNNPINNHNSPVQTAMGETSSLVEGNNIVGVFRTCTSGSCGPTDTIIAYNNTNPYNITENVTQTNLTVGKYEQPYLLPWNGTAYQLYVHDTSDNTLKRFYSTNLIDWTPDCGGNSVIGSPTYNIYNPAITIDQNGNYQMALEDNYQGHFNMRYWNSTDKGCSFTDQGYIWPSDTADLGNAWVQLVNKSGQPWYLLIYGNGTPTNSNGKISVAQGNSLNNLTVTNNNILGSLQSWESIILDPDNVIIDKSIYPRANVSHFDKKDYIYYGGDQKNVGVAYDTGNRSFWQIFNVTPYISPTSQTITFTASNSVNSSSINNFNVTLNNGTASYFNSTTSGTLSIYIGNSPSLWNITINSPEYYNHSYVNQNLSSGSFSASLTHVLTPVLTLTPQNSTLQEGKTYQLQANISYNNQWYTFQNAQFNQTNLTVNSISHTTITNSENTTEEYNISITTPYIQNNDTSLYPNETIVYTDYKGTNHTLIATRNYTLTYAYYPINITTPSRLVQKEYYNPKLHVYQKDNKNMLISGYIENWNGTNQTINLTSQTSTGTTYTYTNKIPGPYNDSDYTLNITPIIRFNANGQNYTRYGVTSQINMYKVRLTIGITPTNASYKKILQYNKNYEETSPTLTITDQYLSGAYYTVINNTDNYQINLTFDTNTPISNTYSLYAYPGWIVINQTDYGDVYFYDKYNNSDYTYARYYWTPTCTVLTNQTSSINLYAFGNANQLYPTDGIVGQITVKDQNGNTIPNAIVKVEKQTSSGNYNTVEVTKTDDSGIALARLIQYRALYKFVIEEDCNVIFTSVPTQIYSTSFSISTTNQTSSSLNLNSSIFQNLQYSLTSNSTDYTLTFNNNNALNGQNCLKYYEYSFPTFTQKNSSCTTDTSGSITLAQDNTTNNRVDYYYNGVLIDSLSNDPNGLNSNLNNAGGIFMGVIFTFLMIGLSVYFNNVFIFFLIEPMMLIGLKIFGFISVNTPTLYGFAFTLFIIGFLGMTRRYQ